MHLMKVICTPVRWENSVILRAITLRHSECPFGGALLDSKGKCYSGLMAVSIGKSPAQYIVFVNLGSICNTTLTWSIITRKNKMALHPKPDWQAACLEVLRVAKHQRLKRKPRSFRWQRKNSSFLKCGGLEHMKLPKKLISVVLALYIDSLAQSDVKFARLTGVQSSHSCSCKSELVLYLSKL